jgi:hypothetical protein
VTRLLIILLAASAAQAQPTWTRDASPFPVYDAGGQPVAFPFAGGLAAPRPQWYDVDGDGDLDLIVQTYADALTLWERVGPLPGDLAWRGDRWHEVEVGQWARMADLDGDGDGDLLAEEPLSGIRYYAATPDGFAPPVGPLVDVETGQPISADRQNVPALADLTCDGVPDLLQAQVDGTLTVFEGLGPGAGGVPRFRLLERAWPGVLVIGDQKAAPSPFGFDAYGPSPPADAEPMHGASALDAADVDGDGDVDLIWGDFFSPSLYLLENDGTCPAPNFSIATVAFPSTALRTAGYNAPALADLDGNGTLDLTVGVVGGAFGTAPLRNLHQLMQRPDGAFTRLTDALVPGLDAGTQSAPAWGDLDGDGDLDLIVGTVDGTVEAWENVGTLSAPELRPVRVELAGLDGFSLAPTTGDLDGDGRTDLIVGTFSGDVFAYRQTGAFVFEPMAAEPLTSLPRGNGAAPAAADVDGDGDLDLIVGESSGDLNLMRNDGSAQAPGPFVAQTEALVERDGSGARPALYVRPDGTLLLVVGTRGGDLHAFGQERPGSAAFERLDWPAPPDALVPDLSPTLADLDGDGAADLTVGHEAGGLRLFWNRRGR